MAGLEENDEDLQNLVNSTRNDEALRARLAADPLSWQVSFTDLGDNLQTKLLTNLAATSVAGPVAVEAGILNALAHNTGSPQVWRLLANIAVSLPPDTSVPLEITQSTAWKSEPTRIPALFAVRNISASIPGWGFEFFRCHGPQLVASLPSFDFEQGPELQLLVNIFGDVLSSEDMFQLAVDSQHTEAELEVLIKLWDAAVASGRTPSSSLSLWLAGELKTLIKTITAHIKNDTRIEGLRTWSTLCPALDLAALLSTSGFRDQFEDTYDAVVELLKASATLPVQNKLRDRYDPRDQDFPGLRSAVLPMFTSLIDGRKSLQDRAREAGAIPCVLSSCIIDANNPFVKERAVLAVRALLSGNATNQDFVARLEARQAADPDALAEAGYELEIQNGKVSLKSK